LAAVFFLRILPLLAFVEALFRVVFALLLLDFFLAVAFVVPIFNFDNLGSLSVQSNA